ncbi:uncharacterized protein LY89DRAFT_689979 [Mollisia scopiformis]|uniref:Uncharacterized protein n=1 Tax=Mollisia scopiformis TaxID=149040 RepID=A0A132BCK5_MOLSC|nr:uncharacterized protein LY89DRAFT_689979 [Mollisia scopiformis]KUJ10160.1 hypothetical protein LY89DRAFT_689979 [Mollisia scopiformis]
MSMTIAPQTTAPNELPTRAKEDTIRISNPVFSHQCHHFISNAISNRPTSHNPNFIITSGKPKSPSPKAKTCMPPTHLHHHIQSRIRIKASRRHCPWSEREMCSWFLSVQNREERQDGGACEEDAWEELEFWCELFKKQQLLCDLLQAWKY